MDHSEVPTGFGQALVQNERAANIFAMMTKEEKQAVWRKARAARSEEEMRQLVSQILSDGGI